MNLNTRKKAFTHALNGIRLFFNDGIHPKAHFFIAVSVVLTGYLTDISSMEWIAVLLCISTVMSLEAVNSAIESLTDLAHPEYHELAKKVKDISAAAVLLSSIFSAIIGGIIFLPKFLS